MIPIKKLGKMRVNNRKNLEYCWLFECSRCGKQVVRATGEGNRLTACSQTCSQLGIARGAYKESIIISGYEYIYKPEHPNALKMGYVAKHRLVLEEKLGRYLDKSEVAHHINEDKLDNRPENIELMTFSKHSSFHAKRKARKNGKFIAV